MFWENFFESPHLLVIQIDLINNKKIYLHLSALPWLFRFLDYHSYKHTAITEGQQQEMWAKTPYNSSGTTCNKKHKILKM